MSTADLDRLGEVRTDWSLAAAKAAQRTGAARGMPTPHQAREFNDAGLWVPA